MVSGDDHPGVEQLRIQAGVFIDDHLRLTFRHTQCGKRGRAFGNGIIQAMIEAVTKLGVQ